MKKCLISLPVVALVGLFFLPASGSAQILLTAGDFALLSGSGALTNTGNSLIDGNVGSSTTVSGFPPGMITVNGSPATPIIGGPTLQAELDLIKAQNGLAGMASTGFVSNGELGGLTLLPGVYTFGPAAVSLDGALFLNANGESNAVWVFNIQTSLITSGTSDPAGASSITLIGGTGSGDAVFWNAETAGITFGAGSTILGNYLAGTSITFDGNNSGGGRLLAQAGLAISGASVSSSEGGPPAGNDWQGPLIYNSSGQVVTSVPEPAAFVWVVALGALGLVLWRRRFVANKMVA